MDEKKHWVDFAAIFIAILALVTSIWSSHETRRHNRLLVKPNVAISAEFAETKDQNGIYLNINGPGPAFIKEFKIFVDGENIKLLPLRNALHDIQKKLNLEDVALTINVPLSSIYRPGDRYLLLGPAKLLSEIAPDQKARIRYNFKRLKMYVKFESLYEDVFIYERNNFEGIFD